MVYMVLDIKGKEAAEKAVHVELCPYRSDLCPHHDISEHDKKVADVAIRAYLSNQRSW
jgi:hypothetical protein